jgi:hypothetical protein
MNNYKFKCLLAATKQIEFTVSHLFVRLTLKNTNAQVFQLLHVEINAFLQERKDVVILHVRPNIILYLPFQLAYM